MPRARVSVGPRGHALTKHKRFPAGTSAQVIRDWRTRTRALLLARLPHATQRGTLASDLHAYRATLPAHQHRFADYALGKWEDALGDVPTLTLTRRDVQRQLTAWRLTLSAGTCNKLRSILAMVYRTRYPDHLSPVVGTDKYREPKGQAPTLTLADVRRILDGLPESTSKRMLRIFAETGAPPVRIQRVQPAHLIRLDQTPPLVYLEPRRKGRGTVGRWFVVTDQGAQAWRAFAAAGDWGGVTAFSLYKVWRAGCVRAGYPPVKPYVLRHIIASELLRRSHGNVFAVADLLDVTLATAQHYARGGVSDAVAELVTAMNTEPPSGQTSGHSHES